METDTAIILTERWVTLLFDPTIPCLHSQWHQGVTSEQFRSVVLQMKDYVIQHQAQHQSIQMLTDIRKIGVVRKEDAEWVANEVDPILHKAGMRKVAFVVPENMFTVFSVHNYQQQTHQQNDDLIQSRVFCEIAEAKQWLKE